MSNLPIGKQKQHVIPVIVRDPRYKAGRATIGEQTSLDVFATLLQEAIFKYGGDNDSTETFNSSVIETAPAYYEYGNALLRYALRQQEERQDEVIDQNAKDDTSKAVAVTTGSNTAAQKSLRETIAAAAERRAKRETLDTGDPLVSDSAQEMINDITTNAVPLAGTNTDVNNGEESYDIKDDIELALEMMETSWSILDAYMQNKVSIATESIATKNKKNYDDWVTEQIPRVLTGIGDTFAALQRHADAVDAYLRALEHRQSIFDNSISNQSTSTTSSSIAATELSSTDKNDDNDIITQVQLLKYRRQVVEVTILLVEELLACGNDQDVQTTESNVILVQKGKVIDYARGYYDRARDELQETVLLLGQIVGMIPKSASTAMTPFQKSVQEEKENICFVATMVMGAGTTLAELDEHEATKQMNEGVEPMKKKSKS
jgi:tetratricopeptide (TPR) repeat protein